jgi:hypothetical protein
VTQAHRHLAADPELNAQERTGLIWHLLDGPVTDAALEAVLDLLNSSADDDRRALLVRSRNFRGRDLRGVLSAKIPAGHRLHGRLIMLIQEWFVTGRTPLGRTFSPTMISSSLPIDVNGDLTREHWMRQSVQ